MPEENNFNQPISLSQAKKIRRENNEDEKVKLSLSVEQLREVIYEFTEKSEQRQRLMMKEVVNEEVSSKITRLENSINKLVNQFERVKNGDAEDAALRVTTDSEASDLAIATTLPTEELYPYTCGMLAEKLAIRQHDVLNLIRKNNLRNDEKYHYPLKTGIKSEVQKWSEAAYQVLKDILNSSEHPQTFID